MRERRSPASIMARAVVVTREEREAYERELEETPTWRLRRRSELKLALQRARNREQGLLSDLGGKPHHN